MQFISQTFQEGFHVSHIDIDWVQPLQLTIVIYRKAWRRTPLFWNLGHYTQFRSLCMNIISDCHTDKRNHTNKQKREALLSSFNFHFLLHHLLTKKVKGVKYKKWSFSSWTLTIISNRFQAKHSRETIY